jgi:hypothetical protein
LICVDAALRGKRRRGAKLLLAASGFRTISSRALREDTMTGQLRGVRTVAADEDHVIAVFRNVLVCIWLRETRAPAVRAAAAALASLAPKHDRRVGLVQVIEPGSRRDRVRWIRMRVRHSPSCFDTGASTFIVQLSFAMVVAFARRRFE